MLTHRLLAMLAAALFAGSIVTSRGLVDLRPHTREIPMVIRSEDPSSAADAIAKVREDWAKRLRAKQLEPLVDLYAADGVFLIPNGQRFAGRDAIRELCRNTMAMMTSDISLRSIVTESSGDLAYDSGQFDETLTRVSDGNKFESHGSYLTVLKKQLNGSWLIVQQAWTGVEPPGLSTPAK